MSPARNFLLNFYIAGLFLVCFIQITSKLFNQITMLRDANPDWVFPNAFWHQNTKNAGHEQGQGKINPLEPEFSFKF
jgi:hypothetical protein